MPIVPSAIIYINVDLVDQVRDHIAKQLHITDILDGYVFDQLVATTPNYPSTIKQQNKRLMVIRPLDDLTNRNLADVVVFFKEGLVSVEKNKFGPPMPAFPALNLHWQQLCIFKYS